MGQHLNADTLARLVDHPAEPGEARHLAQCDGCRAELTALRDQTDALGALPELLPPLGDWDVLEARLRSEGLVRDRGLFDRFGLARTPGWMRAAAAAVLFLGGAGVGAVLGSPGALPTAGGLSGGDAQFAQAATLESAAEAVRRAERDYVTALTRYQALLGTDGESGAMADPSRMAALEYLVAASQAAVRQAPADPFLNGLLASTLAEREATVQRLASRRDTWF